MTLTALQPSASHALASSLLLWVPLGLGWGRAHFAALRRGVGLLLHGQSGALALLLVRLGLSVACLGVAARHGATSLLALFAGFLIARHLALRSSRQAAATAGPP